MHNDAKRFYIDGEVADGNLLETKDRMIHFLENQMRDYGYVPSIDNDPQFTLDYKAETETYAFSLSVYGMKVGTARSRRVSGVASGKEFEFVMT